MILILCWIVAIMSVTGLAWYFYKDIKMHYQELDKKDTELSNQGRELISMMGQQESRCITQLDEISHKKSEAIACYQRAIAKIDESHKIYEQTQNQVIALQKQINKLQSELYNARQKSKRLVKNAGNEL